MVVMTVKMAYNPHYTCLQFDNLARLPNVTNEGKVNGQVDCNLVQITAAFGRVILIE